MSRIPRVTGSDLLAALATAGFAVIRVKCSHHFVRHEDGRSSVVPAHSGETIGPRFAAQDSSRLPTQG
jgi:predicted RNA binding protein YcfA (HicA-like mRNA interferase family)